MPATVEIETARIVPKPPIRKAEVLARSGCYSYHSLCAAAYFVDVRQDCSRGVPMAVLHPSSNGRIILQYSRHDLRRDIVELKEEVFLRWFAIRVVFYQPVEQSVR